LTARDASGQPTEVKIKVESAEEVGAEQTSNQSAILSQDSNRVSLVGSAAPERLYIRLKDASDQALLNSLKEIFDNHPGDTDVVLVLGVGGDKRVIKLPKGINPEQEVSASVSTLVGAANVKLQ
ncbi:MAG: hypothetical protein ACREBW_09040, partial [Candidatus Micrarchaeaceae archaeon]